MRELLIGMPHLGQIDPECQVALFNTTLHLINKGIKCDPRYAEGTYLSTQRNNLAWKALMAGQDLLFVDSDMIFSPGEADLLLDSGKDIIGGLYYARREPYFPLAFRIMDQDEKPRPTKFRDILKKEDNYFVALKHHEIPKNQVFTHPKGLAVGTGFLYIKNEVLASMWSDKNVVKWGRPFNMWQMKNGDEPKEDLAFCLRAHKTGHEVFCHSGVNLIHLGRQKVTENTHLDHVGRSEYFYSNDIQGWMNFNELNWLYNQAKQMDSIVELGSWKGRSTHALLSGCSGTVTAIDHFRGSQKELDTAHKEVTEGVDIKEIFLQNCRKFNNLTLDMSDTAKAANKYEDGSVDMVFIDGGHEYEEVKRDLLAWKDKPTKLLCGHDYTFDGIYQAVREVIGEVRQYETIWFKELS